MNEDGDDFVIEWDDEMQRKHQMGTVVNEEVICGIENVQSITYENMSTDEMIHDTDQIAAENLMHLAHDVVTYADDSNVEYVTEEVITDDWVQPGGQERVEVSIEHFVNPKLELKDDDDIDVPLPTDQDEYTAMRPYPCDFCSRRFRKKAALMNHMVAHQSDRPHACNLCGVSYIRKCDLMNHLKVHAYVPDTIDDPISFEDAYENQIVKPKKKGRGRRKKIPEPEDESMWENMTSARTQQWSRRGRPPPPAPRAPSSSPGSAPSPPPPAARAPTPPPADPSRPFVCRTCGVGFARQKALQSHSRVHGGDSPVECGMCGELCWSRDALQTHHAARHPDHHLHPPPEETDNDEDEDFQMSPVVRCTERGSALEVAIGPELMCQDCGVAFQRADLLRRHVHAAHMYKRHDSTSTWGGGDGADEHSCDVCGEVCPDALQLLAHAELHADRRRLSPAAARLKRVSRGRNHTSTSSGSRQFPCRECGKVFGSRSSQQIHVRIHTGERPYACRFCWKAFADGGTLRKHERIHTGEKPYACAVCPRAFNQRVVLREHVRSHHSAPDRRNNGGPSYCCVVCGHTLSSSDELVQHLIQHCDYNTAMKRQPQNGPRKYKRRRKVKQDVSPGSASPAGSVASEESARSTRSARSAGSAGSARSARSARSAVAPPPPPPRRRKKRLPAPAPRPKMIHTERPPRPRRPARPRAPALPGHAIKEEYEEEEDGPFKCDMCSIHFERRDDLLLHVPVHI